jgi:hypothetical protein
MLNKKSILFFSVLGIVVFTVLISSRQVGICPSYSYSNCASLTESIAEILIPTFILFLFSLITYFMREEVYRAWTKFAIPAVLISMFLIFITPDSSGGGMGPQLSFGKPDMALLTSAIFFIVSLLIIIVRYLKRT